MLISARRLLGAILENGSGRDRCIDAEAELRAGDGQAVVGELVLSVTGRVRTVRAVSVRWGRPGPVVQSYPGTRLTLGRFPLEPHDISMESHEWRERSDEGLRFWRATRHAGRWTFQTTLKSDPEWNPIDPVPRETWEALRDVLWRKYQRKRCPWEWVEQIDKLLEEDYL